MRVGKKSWDMPTTNKQFKEKYRTGMLPGVIFDRLDCEYGKEVYDPNEKFIKIDKERKLDLENVNDIRTKNGFWNNLKIWQTYKPPYPQLPTMWDDNIMSKINDYIKSQPSFSVSRKPKFIIMFDRLGASTKHIAEFFNSIKVANPVDILKNTISNPIVINDYNLVDYLYFNGDVYDHSMILQELPAIVRGYNTYKKYMDDRNSMATWREPPENHIRKSYGRYDYNIDNYSDLVHIAKYVRYLQLEQLNTYQNDILFHYTNRNAYTLTCLFDNYKEELKKYDVEFYFPNISDDIYKKWVVYNAKNGRLTQPWLVDEYETILVNNLIYTLLMTQETDNLLKVFALDINTQQITPITNNVQFPEGIFKPNIKIILDFWGQTSGLIKQFTKSSIIDASPIELNFTNETIQNLKKYETMPNEGDGTPESYIQFHYNKFVSMQTANKSENPSIHLLYGPPGVGKSTITKKIKQELEDNCVIINLDDLVMGSKHYMHDSLKVYQEVYKNKDSLYAALPGELGGKLVDILLNTVYLNVKRILFHYYSGHLNKCYFKLINWAKDQKYNIITEAVGKKDDNRIHVLHGSGYKKYIHAIHVKATDEYLNVISRSLTEGRYSTRSNLLKYANDSFENLQNIINDPSYNDVDIIMYDNTDIDKQVILFTRKNNIIECSGTPNYSNDELGFSKLWNEQCPSEPKTTGGFEIFLPVYAILIILLLVIIYIFYNIFIIRNVSNDY